MFHMLLMDIQVFTSFGKLSVPAGGTTQIIAELLFSPIVEDIYSFQLRISGTAHRDF